MEKMRRIYISPILAGFLDFAWVSLPFLPSFLDLDTKSEKSKILVLA